MLSTLTTFCYSRETLAGLNRKLLEVDQEDAHTEEVDNSTVLDCLFVALNGLKKGLFRSKR